MAARAHNTRSSICSTVISLLLGLSEALAE
jgi:hypothetical protein